MTTKAYLGDGVYCDHNEFEIILTTSDGIRDTNTIYLDESVLRAFCRYLSRIDDARAEKVNDD